MKFGIDQFKNPAPKWFTRLVNAMILFVMPAMATFMISIPDQWISPEIKNFLGAGATFGIAFLKGIQFFLGEENS